MQLCRRVFFVVLLLALGCKAQVPKEQADRIIEHQVRNYFQIPSSVQIQIGPRKPSEFPNYDTVTVTLTQGDHKQDTDFLLSKDGKTLLRMSKLDLTKDPYAELMNKINILGRPVRGNKDAKVTVVSYDDFQCPYCGHMHQQLFSQIFPGYADRVRVIYKDYPLPSLGHDWAIHAAVDANCLGAQNNDAYWELADYIHGNQGAINQANDKDGAPKRRSLAEATGELDKLTFDYGRKHNVDMPKLQACVTAQKDDAVRSSVEEGSSLGVNGTPTLFVNGEKIDGAVPPAMVRDVINRALREAGEPVPPPTAPSAAKPAGQPH